MLDGQRGVRASCKAYPRSEKHIMEPQRPFVTIKLMKIYAKGTIVAVTANSALTLAENSNTCSVHSKTAANDAAGPAALPTKISKQNEQVVEFSARVKAEFAVTCFWFLPSAIHRKPSLYNSCVAPFFYQR